MSQSLKRCVHPMTDLKEFLEEGKREFEYLFGQEFECPLTPQHFEFHQLLGEGAFGKVILARKKLTNQPFAVKVLEKERIVATKQVKHVFNEKRVLQALNHPFTVYLEGSFKDNVYLFLVLPFVEGGEMFVQLRRLKTFPEHLSKFYGGQVLLALEYLHYCQMIFRDLKPENILIDSRGFVKLTDFGFCKVVPRRTYTLCGTPEYMAPEILLRKGYGGAVDWWSFGVLLYEMSAGYPPFHSGDAMKTYERIISGRYSFPSTFSPELRDLVSNLLQVDLTRRYGNLRHGVEDIKNHEWFSMVNWYSLFNRQVEAPHITEVQSTTDLNNTRKCEKFNFLTRESSACSKIFDGF